MITLFKSVENMALSLPKDPRLQYHYGNQTLQKVFFFLTRFCRQAVNYIVTFEIIGFAQFSCVYKKCNIMWNIYCRWRAKYLILIFSKDHCHDFFIGEPLVRPRKQRDFSIILVQGMIWNKPFFSFSSIRISINKQKTLVRLILTWEKNNIKTFVLIGS